MKLQFQGVPACVAMVAGVCAAAEVPVETSLPSERVALLKTASDLGITRFSPEPVPRWPEPSSGRGSPVR